MTLDTIRRVTLEDALKINFRPSRFLTKNFFTQVRTLGTPGVAVDIVKNGVTVPAFVSRRDKDGNPVEHPLINTNIFNPPHYHEHKDLSAVDFDDRKAGEGLMIPNEAIINAREILNDDLADLNNRLDRLIEAEAIEALTNGTVTVKNKDGQTLDTINFGMDGSHQVIPNVMWNASGKDWNGVLADIRGWNSGLLGKDSGRGLTDIVLGKDAYSAFIAAADAGSSRTSITIDRGRIAPETRERGVTLVSNTLGELGNPQIWSYDEYFGANPAFPANKVLLLSRDATFKLVFAKIPNIHAPAYAQRYGYIYEDPKGKGYEVNLESCPLPIPYEIDAVVVAQVV